MEVFFSKCPFLLSLIIAEGVLLLVKHKDLKVLIKKENQRTREEKKYIKNGMVRALLVDLFLVPISLFILYFLVFIPLKDKIAGISNNQLFSYSVLGVIAYGFPFASVKVIIQQIAMSTLRNFAKIVVKATETEEVKDG